MSVLPHQLSNDAAAAIGELIEAIQKCRRQEGLDRNEPWSLAELKLDYNDHLLMEHWLKSLTKQTLHQSLRLGSTLDSTAIPSNAAIGLLLLIVIANTAQRKSRPGSVWSEFAALEMRGLAREELLGASGQPTALLKEMLQAAADYFNLRNAVGDYGTQQWYGTVQLQFGIPQQVDDDTLRQWLAGMGVPRAIQILLGNLEVDQYSSNSFNLIWKALRDLSDNRDKEHEVRVTLRDSLWVPNSMVEKLLEAALAGAIARTPEDGPRSDDRKIVEHLRFLQDEGYLLVDIPPLQFDAKFRYVDLLVNGKRLDRLERETDGLYHSTHPKNLRVEIAAVLVFSIVAPDNDTLAPQTIEIVRQDNKPTVFRADGTMHMGSMQLGDSYTLAHLPGTRILPNPSHSWRQGPVQFSLITAKHDTRLLENDELLWELTTRTIAAETSRRQPLSEGVYCQSSDGKWHPHSLHQPLELQDIERNPIKVVPPPSFFVHKPMLMAGSRVLSYGGIQAQAIRGAQGLGERLWLRNSNVPFRNPEASWIVLAEQIVDHGILESVTVEGNRLEFSLRQELEFGEGEYRLVIWQRDGHLRNMPVPSSAVPVRTREFTIERDCANPRAVALAYGSARSGAYWAEDWSEELPSESPYQTIKNLRRMKCPYLAEPHASRIRDYAKKHIISSFGSWMDAGKPDEEDQNDAEAVSCLGEPSSDFYWAVRLVLGDSLFQDRAGVDEFTCRYSKVPEANDLPFYPQSSRLLLNVAPKLVHDLHQKAYLHPEVFLRELLNTHCNAKPRQQRPLLQELESQCTRNMGIPREALEMLHEGHVGAQELSLSALNFEYFRKWSASRFLFEMQQARTVKP